MRGEHLAFNVLDILSGGSSPHARGALATSCFGDTVEGIIPACAGSTSSSAPGWPCRRDHPRMRGEHGLARWLRIPWPGSSPHARGAPKPFSKAVRTQGIIPACAGSTTVIIDA